MAVRRDEVQLHLDFITDESRALARTLETTKAYNREIAASTAKIAEYQRQLVKVGADEAKRAPILTKIAAEEKKVADNLARVAAEGKKVEALDLTKVTPAQLVERAKQLALAMRQIPQSAPQFAQLQGELSRVNGQLRQINQTAKGIVADSGGGGLFQRILGVAGGVGLFELARNGIRSIVNFGRAAVAEVDAQLKADAQIKEAIRSTGGVAGKSLDELKRQAEELQKVTLFGDEQTEGAQALLLTFKNIRGEIFDQTVPLVQDLATAFKQDLSSSAIQVGKALEDPIRGVTALRRVGITFSEDQQKMIKSLVETGRVADAQRIILRELETQVGGSARAAAQAGAGPWQQLKNVFGEIKEVVGGFIIDIGSNLVANLKDFGNSIIDFVNGPQKSLKEQTEDLQAAFNSEIEVLLRGNFTQEERGRLIGEINKKYKDYLPNLIDEKASLEEIAAAQRAANAEFAQKILFLALEEEILKVQKEGKEAAEIAFAAERKRGKLRQEDRRKDLQDVGAYTDFLKKQDESLAALREGGLGVVRETPQRIAEVEKEFETLAASLGTTVDELRKKFAAKPEDGGGDTVTGKIEEESKAAQGSIAFLRKQISDLQKEIEESPDDVKVLQPLIEQLKEAEARLKSLEARLNRLKNPPKEQAASAEEVTRQLGLGADTDPELTDAKLEEIVALNDFIVQEEEKTVEELNKFREGLSDEDRRRREETLAAEAEMRKNLRDFELSAAQSVADAYLQIQANRLQAETDAALSALDSEYAERIKAAEGNSREQARLQKELDRKKEAIEKEAAGKRKALAIKEAIIAGALAVVRALPNLFAAAAAGVAAAAQIAIIASQKFARGGFTGGGFGAPDDTGYRPAGVVHEGEYVVPKWQVQSGEGAALVRLLEQRRLRGFAEGGFVNTTPTALPSVAASQAINLGQLDMLDRAVTRFERVVAQFPTEVKSRVVYTEIEEVGTDLNAVRADAAL